MSDLFNIAIGLAYMAAAFVIFDRVLATLRRDLFVRYLKLWCLGVAVGLFGLARLTGVDLFYNIAHPCLIVYVALQIHHLTSGQKCRWGRPD